MKSFKVWSSYTFNSAGFQISKRPQSIRIRATNIYHLFQLKYLPFVESMICELRIKCGRDGLVLALGKVI